MKGLITTLRVANYSTDMYCGYFLNKSVSSNTQFMNCFLIDFENVKSAGLKGIEHLIKDDDVYIFYSDYANSITFDIHHKMNQSNANIQFFKSSATGKNALDFQLISYLGYLIAQKKYKDYLVITDDRGFESAVKFWKDFFKQNKLSDLSINRFRSIQEALDKNAIAYKQSLSKKVTPNVATLEPKITIQPVEPLNVNLVVNETTPKPEVTSESVLDTSQITIQNVTTNNVENLSNIKVDVPKQVNSVPSKTETVVTNSQDVKVFKNKPTFKNVSVNSSVAISTPSLVEKSTPTPLKTTTNGNASVQDTSTQQNNNENVVNKSKDDKFKSQKNKDKNVNNNSQANKSNLFNNNQNVQGSKKTFNQQTKKNANSNVNQKKAPTNQPQQHNQEGKTFKKNDLKKTNPIEQSKTNNNSVENKTQTPIKGTPTVQPKGFVFGKVNINEDLSSIENIQKKKPNVENENNQNVAIVHKEKQTVSNVIDKNPKENVNTSIVLKTDTVKPILNDDTNTFNNNVSNNTESIKVEDTTKNNDKSTKPINEKVSKNTDTSNDTTQNVESKTQSNTSDKPKRKVGRPRVKPIQDETVKPKNNKRFQGEIVEEKLNKMLEKVSQLANLSETSHDDKVKICKIVAFSKSKQEGYQAFMSCFGKSRGVEIYKVVKQEFDALKNLYLND